MTVSREPQITEELLSAYLDDQVTAEERALVEAAIATDPAIAWQVDSLRQTVQLLQALPPLTLPRTFTIEALLAEARATEAAAPFQPKVVASTNHAPRRPVARTPIAEEPQTPWWQWFLQLWQGGNLQLRNAAAVALTLFFVLIAGDRFLVTTLPLEEATPVAPVAVTSQERTAVEPPVAPTAAAPTATSEPSDVAVTAAVKSNDQVANAATDNATANTFANRAAQAEDKASRPENATMAASGGAPGPVEGVLNPDSGVSADAPTAQTFGAPPSAERAMMAKSMTPTSDAVAANAAVTQEDALVAETPVTTTAPTTTSLSALVTATALISVTPTMTPTVTITPTVLPMVTMASATPLASVPPTGDRGGNWLTWAQIITAFSTVALAGLWLRSRR